ncbi:hypothetical protein N7E81_19050 [Reichenbachiella carrageenanivorans]|uniref:Lipocalin-like domain-containing protein n=1 Tax=Reichenbachiella carrageenanivorans TaxID=2979869 RepID=A0ABY6CZV7_9BACT|nr:hypothetical protein [Reichenbachiella carrageenanivorans]UXX79450.1 hypothetical protein N7E81_19050 [Reichenbachiella carrageenanivorans]
MNKLIVLISLLIGFQLAIAQNGRVKERDLAGVWKMKISLEDGILEEEIKGEDNAFARLVLAAAGNLVEGILDEIAIEIEFRDDHECRVYVSAFGEEEVEYTRWEISDDGKLYIDDSDSFQMDGEEYLIFEDGRLVVYEDGRPLDDEASVYLIRVD